MNKLKNKNCVITGAASGIGRSLAIGLAMEKMNLFITDIDIENLRKVEILIKKLGVKVFSAKCDVSKYEDFQNLANEVYSKLGELDLLINNAGIAIGGFTENLEQKDWKRVLDINLWSIIYSIKVFLPRMLKRGAGHIVNTASGAGVIGLPHQLPYVASKFAVVGITEGLYSELNGRGLNFSVICPTIIKTNIIDKSDVRIPPELLSQYNKEEIDERLEEFKIAYWNKFIEKGLTPYQAAKYYIRGIKKNKLYIFDKKLVPLAMLIKGISRKFYQKVLEMVGKEDLKIIEEVLSELGIKK